MATNDLEGKRLIVIGPWNVLEVVRLAVLEHRLPPLLVVNRIAGPELMPITQRLVMQIKTYTPEPMPEVRIEKKDKYSFLDGVVGRGKGRAKSQGYAQHFKR